jgi:hypothetical protein
MPRLAASIATRKAAGDLPTWSLRAPATDRDRGDKSWSRVTQLCIFRFAVIPRVVAQLAYNFAVSERVCEYMTHLLCTVCDPRRPSGRRRPPFAPRRTSAVRCEDVSGNETDIGPYGTSSPRKRYQHPSLRHYAPFQMRWKGTQQTRWKRTQATTQPNQITTETEWFGPVTQGMVTPHTGRCNLRQRLHGTKRGEVPSSSQSLTSPYTPSFSRTPPAFFFPLGPIQIKRVPSPTNRQKQNGESRF